MRLVPQADKKGIVLVEGQLVLEGAEDGAPRRVFLALLLPQGTHKRLREDDKILHVLHRQRGVARQRRLEEVILHGARDELVVVLRALEEEEEIGAKAGGVEREEERFEVALLQNLQVAGRTSRVRRLVEWLGVHKCSYVHHRQHLRHVQLQVHLALHLLRCLQVQQTDKLAGEGGGGGAEVVADVVDGRSQGVQEGGREGEGRGERRERKEGGEGGEGRR
mmetsp:Transcript_35572/g.80270  ORF Transcript_35572/g.80270 Transcript_35572/m.80270 type:complete len:221 (-) Transcript_35572:1099-1761(-)